MDLKSNDDKTGNCVSKNAEALVECHYSIKSKKNRFKSRHTSTTMVDLPKGFLKRF